MRRALALSLSLAVVGGCTQQAPDPEPLAPAPRIVVFEASPTQVRAGQEVVLRWNVGDAERVEILDSVRGALAGPPNLKTGEVKVQVFTDTVFVLNAVNSRGVKATKLVSVHVAGADPARPVLFSVFPEVLRPGEEATLVWSAPDALAVTVSDGAGELDLQGQGNFGSVTVAPQATRTTYTLRADAVQKQVAVTRAPEAVELTAVAPLAGPGEAVTVAWKTRHATKVTITAEGRGTLTTVTDEAQLAQGTFRDIVPALTEGARVSYTATVEGPGGEATRKATVVVGKLPTVVQATLPRYAKLGSTFTVTWRTANADRVAIRADGATVWESLAPGQASSGSLELRSPNVDTTYTVVAINSASGVEARRELPLEIVGEVAITSLQATPDTTSAGCAPVTLSWKAVNARRVRLVENGQLTYVFREGRAAEAGSVTVYPNRASTTYQLVADNTIDPPQSAQVAVRNTAPASFKQVGGGVVFADQSEVNLDYSDCTGGSAVSGVAYADAALRQGSTGFEDISRTGTELEFADSDNGVTAFQPRGMETFVMGNRRAGNWYAYINGYVIPGEPYYVYGYWYPYFLWYYNGNGIFPFAADLVTGSTGKVFWEQKGEQPNAYVVVQWDKMQVTGQPTSSLTFQAKIYQTGAVVFEYADLTVSSNTFTHYSGTEGTFNYGQPTPHVKGPFMNNVLTYSYTDPSIPNTPVPLSVKNASFAINEERTQGAARAVPTNLPFSGWVKVGQGLARVPLDKFVGRGAFAINEVMYAPASGVTAGEWLEIRNTSSVAIDLSGMSLDFSTNGTNIHAINTSVVVQPGTAVVLGQSTVASENDNARVDYAYGNTFIMPDSSGTVRLMRGTAVLSTASWSSSSGGATGRAVHLNQEQLVGTWGSLYTFTCGAVSGYGSRGQRGTPGRLSSCYGYMMEPFIRNTYNDVSVTGTRAELQEHPGFFCDSPVTTSGYANINLGTNTFPYFGATATEVTLHVGGWMYARRDVPTSSSCYQYIYTYPFASYYSSYGYPADRVMSVWGGYSYSYLQNFSEDEGGLFYRRVAADEDPSNPAPHWVFQWEKLRPGDSYSSGSVSFQAKIFDDGTIEYHYGAAEEATPIYSGYPAWHEGADATIWLESPDTLFSNYSGTSFALAYSLKNRVIQPGVSAVRFRRTPP